MSVAIAAVAPVARAQPASAQAELLFRQAKELMAAGRIAEACAGFDASQQLEPMAATALNQANCRERNRQLATAWGLYVEVAILTRGGADRAARQMHRTATERARLLENRLSTLRVDVPSGSRTAGVELRRNGERVDPATWNQPLPLDGGSYQLTATAPGRIAWSLTVELAAERDARIVEVPPLAAAPAAPVVPVVPAVIARPASPLTSAAADEPASGDRSRWTTRRKLAAASAGAAVLAIAAGSVVGVTAQRKQRDADALCPVPSTCGDPARATALNRAGHDRAIAANALFGIGAAAAIAAGVLWFTGAPAHHSVAIAAMPASDQLILVASGRF